MDLRARILKVLRAENGGERKRSVLAGLAGGDAKLRPVLTKLMDEGLVVMRRCYGGQRYGLGKQRGFVLPSLMQLILIGIAISSVIGVVWGAVAWHANTHFERGVKDERAKWNKKEEERRQAQQRRDDAVAAALLLEQQKALDAGILAEESDRKWREAQRDAEREGKRLAECEAGPAESGGGDARGVPSPGEPSAAPPPAGGDHPRHAAAPGVRFTWEFVRQYDTAWTGLDGKPLPQALGGGEGAELAGVAPYTPADVIEVHGENSQACSADRRELAELIAKIQRAAETYDRGSR